MSKVEWIEIIMWKFFGVILNQVINGGGGGDSFESVDRDWVLFLRFIILIEKVCFLYILNWKKGISFK